MAQTPWQLAPRSALVHAFEDLARGITNSEEIKNVADLPPTAGLVTRVLGLIGARA
jgi:hypothetical protein